MRRIYNFRSGIFTHQPVLFAVAEVCDGPIAECGCGEGSTWFLHEIAERRGIKVISFETHEGWLSRYSHLRSEHHELRLVSNWSTEVQNPEWTEHWGLVFIDQEHWEDRVVTLNRVRETADYVILHDSDSSPNHGVGGEIRPLRGPHDVGERDYTGVFTSWVEYFPPTPWPNKDAGPPTLLASNRLDVHSVDVNYHRHLPYWWRLARHLNGVIPQPLKARIGARIGWRFRPGYSQKERIG